jgi:hypothetical protein
VEILFVQPSGHFIFVESRGAFEHRWKSALSSGDLLEESAARVDWRWPAKELPAARRISLSALTLESVEIFDGSSPWMGQDLPTVRAAHDRLVRAWEAGRPAHEKAAKALADERLAHARQTTNESVGEQIERDLRQLAKRAAAIGVEAISLHRGAPSAGERPIAVGPGYILHQHVVTSVTDSGNEWKGGTSKSTPTAYVLTGEGLVFISRLTKITAPRTGLNGRYRRLIGYGPQDLVKVVDELWVRGLSLEPSNVAISQRGLILKAAIAFCAHHGIAHEFERYKPPPFDKGWAQMYGFPTPGGGR